MAEEIELFVGIDWASQSHQVCPIDARGQCAWNDRYAEHLRAAWCEHSEDFNVAARHCHGNRVGSEWRIG